MSLSKPWSISTFERERPYLTNFIKNEIQPLLECSDIRRLVIRAPVKSGKREMVEYIALRDHQSKGQQFCEHAFISAFHRTADKDQREEIEAHGLTIFSIINKKKTQELTVWIRKQISQKKQVILHLDECDHGSGEHQQLSSIWREFNDNTWVTIILYSATPEEVKHSGEIDHDIDDIIENIMKEAYFVEYTPPDGFCGPGRFLDENLVFEAEPFFHSYIEEHTEKYTISEQGKNIIGQLRESIVTNPKRNILILRLSHGMGKKVKGTENKASHIFVKHLESFAELNDFIIAGDKGEKFGNVAKSFISSDISWSQKGYWDMMCEGKPICIIIDQTSSRSTEWACHDRVFALHDFRSNVTFSVCSQAQERPNHYESKYGGFQQIHIYGSIKTFQLSAGYISYQQYLQMEYRKHKVSVGNSHGEGEGEAMYQIISNIDNSIHPEYNEVFSKVDANKILLRLGSLIPNILSTRIKGNIKRVQEITCNFMPCTSETFISLNLKMRNPFDKSKEEMIRYPDRYPIQNGYIGHMRNWKVWDYSEIEKNRGWGFSTSTTISRATICYSNGILGIALRIPTGNITTVNDLTSHKSMYESR